MSEVESTFSEDNLDENSGFSNALQSLGEHLQQGQEPEVESGYEEFPTFDETEVLEPVAAEPIPAPADPLAALSGNDNISTDFNLATLAELIDGIKEESQRVSSMKNSVAEALSVIQEITDSLIS